MADNDPLDRLQTYDLDADKPVQTWTSDFDGPTVRNAHEAALAARDNALLGFLKAVQAGANPNISPLYPFKDDATLTPSSATPYDADGAEITGFVIDPTALSLSNRFIKDLKLVLASEFIDPYLSRISIHQSTDPDTNLVRIFVDLFFSARYVIDQSIQVILTLQDKAYNDVQDNSAPSSRDNTPLLLTPQPVDSRNFLIAGTIEFNFIGAVQNGTATSWTAGVYGGVVVEGFNSVPGLQRVEYEFTYEAGKLTQLAYNNLGDLANAVPFLAKVKSFPFDGAATAGTVLAKCIRDVEITAPPFSKVFIKRIRRDAGVYTLVFAYNERDAEGNNLGIVNVGVAVVTSTSGTRVEIKSLGSNRINGADPTWLDEVIGDTQDAYGRGTLIVADYASLGLLFDELLAVTVEVGSPSPILVSPAENPPIVGLYVDPDEISMIEDNSYLDGLAKDTQGYNITVTERIPLLAAPTRNVTVLIGDVKVTRRMVYGTEAQMRDFYGIGTAETLVNSDKIDLDDEWFNSVSKTLNRYQLIDGQRKWRIV